MLMSLYYFFRLCWYAAERSTPPLVLCDGTCGSKNTNGTSCKTLRVDIHPDSRIRLGINLRFFCVGKFLRQFAALKKALSECFMYYEIWPKLRIFMCTDKLRKTLHL